MVNKEFQTNFLKDGGVKKVYVKMLIGLDGHLQCVALSK